MVNAASKNYEFCESGIAMRPLPDRAKYHSFGGLQSKFQKSFLFICDKNIDIVFRLCLR